MQMKAKDLQTQSTEELNNQLATLKEELFNLRFQHATGQLDNPIRIREVKKDYARIKTVLRGREINA
jgi:large subunit ribosomal protein L29